MPDTKSILVLGAGVIGLSTAYYASRRGLQVTLVDRGDPGHDCCSLGNAGMIVPSHFIPLAAPGMVSRGLRMMFKPDSPFYIRPRLSPDLIKWCWKFCRHATASHVSKSSPLLRDLHLASRQRFEELAELTGNDFGLVQKGLLMLCKSSHTLEEEAGVAANANALGVPAQVLTASQTAQLDPGITMDVAGSVYFPRDCHLSPSRFMAGLTRHCQTQGVKFLWNTEVSGWKKENNRIAAVQTSQGDLTASEYVIAGGAWSPNMLHGLRLNLPMQAGKGYSITLDHPRQLPELCSILTEARVAVTPMGHSLRFGGTMEIAGLDSSINPNRVGGIIKSIPRYFPEFKEHDFTQLPVWRGLRPCSPDGLPYIGRFSRYRNLSAATGHAMLGLSLAPITGHLMTQILSNEPTDLDLTLLSPNR